MILILAGASPVLRNVKPSIGSVCVCALGHWDGYQRSRLLPVATPKTYLSHVAVRICPWIPIDFHNHSLNQLGELWKRKPVFRTLPGELWCRQSRERRLWLTQYPPLKLYLQSSVAMRGYLDQYRSCGQGHQFPAVAIPGRKPCG